MVIVMIIGLAEPGQGEKLGRNNKKKAAGERERERETGKPAPKIN